MPRGTGEFRDSRPSLISLDEKNQPRVGKILPVPFLKMRPLIKRGAYGSIPFDEARKILRDGCEARLVQIVNPIDHKKRVERAIKIVSALAIMSFRRPFYKISLLSVATAAAFGHVEIWRPCLCGLKPLQKVFIEFRVFIEQLEAARAGAVVLMLGHLWTAIPITRPVTSPPARARAIESQELISGFEVSPTVASHIFRLVKQSAIFSF